MALQRLSQERQLIPVSIDSPFGYLCCVQCPTVGGFRVMVVVM